MQKVKRLVERAAGVPLLGLLVSQIVSLALSGLDRSRVRFRREGSDLRFELASGAVLYSTEFDLLISSRLRAEAERYYLPNIRLSAGDVVVDAGASIGTFSFVAAELVGPTGKVIAVEAHPASFERLRRGVEASRFDNIVCVHAALVAVDGPVRIDDSIDDYRLNAISETGGSEIEGRSLTSLSVELGVERIALLKMNIEGAEVDALEGASPLADAGALRAVAVSCHDFMAEHTGQDSYRTRAAVTDWLKRHGFAGTWGSDFTAQAPLRDYVWAARA